MDISISSHGSVNDMACMVLAREMSRSRDLRDRYLFYLDLLLLLLLLRQRTGREERDYDLLTYLGTYISNRENQHWKLP